MQTHTMQNLFLISNMAKISGSNRSAKITDHFTYRSAYVIYCITCTIYKKICTGQTERRLPDRFSEHLRNVQKNDKDTSKPVARHFNLPNHSHLLPPIYSQIHVTIFPAMAKLLYTLI